MVVKVATVTRGTEYCYEFAIGKELITVLHDLVAPYYEINVKLLYHSLDYVLTEYVADSPIVVAPFVLFYVEELRLRKRRGIRPKQVAKNAMLWDLLRSLNLLDLVQLIHVFAQTSMHTENSILN